jgi:dihydrofolate reductase
MIRLAVIVAAAENGVIGRNNGLPWHLPEDLRYFKRVTMGKPIVMGRRTFESIGRPLPGRANIVISRNPRYSAAGVRLVASLDEALVLAEHVALSDGVGEVVVIGGAEIYALALPRATRLYLTRVHARVEGDALLPPLDWKQWREVSRERHAAAGGNPFDYSFLVYERSDSGKSRIPDGVLPEA